MKRTFTQTLDAPVIMRDTCIFDALLDDNWTEIRRHLDPLAARLLRLTCRRALALMPDTVREHSTEALVVAYGTPRLFDMLRPAIRMKHIVWSSITHIDLYVHLRHLGGSPRQCMVNGMPVVDFPAFLLNETPARRSTLKLLFPSTPRNIPSALPLSTMNAFCCAIVRNRVDILQYIEEATADHVLPTGRAKLISLLYVAIRSATLVTWRWLREWAKRHQVFFVDDLGVQLTFHPAIASRRTGGFDCGILTILLEMGLVRPYGLLNQLGRFVADATFLPWLQSALDKWPDVVLPKLPTICQTAILYGAFSVVEWYKDTWPNQVTPAFKQTINFVVLRSGRMDAVRWSGQEAIDAPILDLAERDLVRERAFLDAETLDMDFMVWLHRRRGVYIGFGSFWARAATMITLAHVDALVAYALSAEVPLLFHENESLVDIVIDAGRGPILLLVYLRLFATLPDMRVSPGVAERLIEFCPDVAAAETLLAHTLPAGHMTMAMVPVVLAARRLDIAQWLVARGCPLERDEDAVSRVIQNSFYMEAYRALVASNV